MIQTIRNEFLEVQVNSEGAQLWSIVERCSGTQFLWQGDPNIWELRAPVIFPYCGRIRDFKFIDGDGAEYHGQNHGFARFQNHDLKECGEGRVIWNLPCNEETKKLYPYQFEFNTEYRLEGNALCWIYHIKNLDRRPMPFNVGYHPGFMCPFDVERDISDYELVFEKEETPIQLVSDENGQLRTGEERVLFEKKRRIPLKDGMFPKNYCVTGLVSQYVDILEKPTGRYIRVHIGGFPNEIFWSKPGKIHFLCIEPWTGLADDENSDYRLEHKRDIQILEPGGCYEKELRIEFGTLGGCV